MKSDAPTLRSAAPSRLPVVDLLKALAAQLVLLHHLSAYGPIAAVVEEGFPNFSAWLFDYARMAVQIFLVIGGYLCARGLLAPNRELPRLGDSFVNRYLRLVLPYMVGLVLAVACAAIARRWLDDDFIPGAPGLLQWLAHVFLLQGLLGFESLSSGVWYVAVDFQLFILTVLVFRLSHGLGQKFDNIRVVALLACVALTIASVFYFNRDSRWDNLALYFFGAYGLGVVASWIGRQQWPDAWVVLLTAVISSALLVDFRGRLLLALVTALLLIVADQWGRKLVSRLAASTLIHQLGKSSYSLFLVHFSVILLCNALFERLAIGGQLAGAMGMALAWSASLFASGVFYRWVEAPTAALKISLPRFTLGRRFFRNPA